MNSFPRLLCLAVLATSAYAQTPDSKFVTSDPTLAGEFQSAPAKPSAAQVAKPVPQTPVLTARNAEPMPDLQVRTPAGHNLLPTATVLRIKLDRPISTATARPGTPLEATLTRAVEVDGRTILPSGTRVNCRLESAHGARRFAGKPSLMIKALSARMPNGDELYFSASMVDTGNPRHLDVDSEGRLRGLSPNPMNNIELGALSGAGAVAGAVIAGPEGLLFGTASGALIAAGHIVIKHRDLTLPVGTELIFELDAPATTERPQYGGEQ
jgi:hypothetical protein